MKGTLVKRIADHQQDIVDWGHATFSKEHYSHQRERFLRALEELVEVGQAIDIPYLDYYSITHQVYKKPKETDIGSEIGGALFTLLALAHSLGLNAEEELERAKASAWAKQDKIRQKQFTKYRVESLDQFIKGEANGQG